MPKREKKPKTAPAHGDAWIKDAGVVARQPITDTLQLNYMPYAMSVIISRALPEIDGFKPSHRSFSTRQPVNHYCEFSRRGPITF